MSRRRAGSARVCDKLAAPRPRVVRECDPQTTVAARPCAALETKCKQSPRATERRKEGRAKSRSSVECASHATRYASLPPDSLLLHRTHGATGAARQVGLYEVVAAVR